MGILSNAVQISQDKGGSPSDQQRLIFARKQFEDGHVLSEDNIKIESTFIFALEVHDGIQNMVETLDGRIVTFDVKPSDTIENIKAEILV